MVVQTGEFYLQCPFQQQMHPFTFCGKQPYKVFFFKNFFMEYLF